jgi:hypothetical protein
VARLWLSLLLALVMTAAPPATRAEIEAGPGVSVEAGSPAAEAAAPAPDVGQAAATSAGAAAMQPATPNTPPGLGWLTNREAALTIILLVFALVYLYVAVFIFTKIKEKSIEPVVRFASMLVIVVAALVLMFVGYDSQQVAPAYGLLGTLAGYILGRSDRKEPPDASPNP